MSNLQTFKITPSIRFNCTRCFPVRGLRVSFYLWRFSTSDWKIFMQKKFSIISFSSESLSVYRNADRLWPRRKLRAVFIHFPCQSLWESGFFSDVFPRFLSIRFCVISIYFISFLMPEFSHFSSSSTFCHVYWVYLIVVWLNFFLQNTFLLFWNFSLNVSFFSPHFILVFINSLWFSWLEIFVLFLGSFVSKSCTLCSLPW